MLNKRIDEIKKALDYMHTEEGWNEWANIVGDWNAWDEKWEMEVELRTLFEAGYYGTEEAHYIIGVVD